MSTTPPVVTTTDLRAHFGVLDTMRAVGALAVLTTHCAFTAGAYDDAGALGRLMARMDVGVALFFVLSGFLLARPWLVRAREGRPSPGTAAYLRKRARRIYPAYAAVAVLALVVLRDNHDRSPVQWVTTLLMGDVYVSDTLPYGLTQTWSLATEVAFYLVLPLLMLLAVGRRRRLRVGRVLAVLVGMAVLNVWWLLDLSARVPDAVRTPHVNEWLPAYLTWFAVGIGLALVQAAPGDLPRCDQVLRGLAASPGSCWAAALAVLLVAGTSVAGPTALVPATTGEAVTKNLLYAVVGLLLVLPGVYSVPGSRYHQVMTARPLRRVGMISYSLFLVHMTVLELVMGTTGLPLFGGHFVVIFGLTLIVSLVLADLLYRWVERTCLDPASQGVAGDGAKADTEIATNAATTP